MPSVLSFQCVVRSGSPAIASPSQTEVNELKSS